MGDERNPINSWDSMAARGGDAQVLAQLCAGMKRRLKFAQALSKRELSKRLCEPLVVAAKSLACRVAVIALKTATRGLAVAQAHHLRKQSLSGHPRRIGPDRAGRTQNA